MNAPPQIEPEEHGPHPQGPEPPGQVGGQGHGAFVALREGPVDDLLTLELIAACLEADQELTRVGGLDRLDGDLGVLQGRLDFAGAGIVDLAPAGGGHLDGGVLGKDVGQGKEQAAQDHGQE